MDQSNSTYFYAQQGSLSNGENRRSLAHCVLELFTKQWGALFFETDSRYEAASIIYGGIYIGERKIDYLVGKAEGIRTNTYIHVRHNQSSLNINNRTWLKEKISLKRSSRYSFSLIFTFANVLFRYFVFFATSPFAILFFAEKSFAFMFFAEWTPYRIM